MISWNITNCPKLLICRWYHHRGTITDITKTGRQVKKTLNLIFGKFSEPTGTLLKNGFLGQNTSILTLSVRMSQFITLNHSISLNLDTILDPIFEINPSMRSANLKSNSPQSRCGCRQYNKNTGPKKCVFAIVQSAKGISYNCNINLPVSDHAISSSLNPCDIHLKHVIKK